MNRITSGRPLTPRQQDVYDFLREFFDENDQLPPQDQIARHLNVRLNTVCDHMAALVRKGWIERNACVGKYRFRRERAAALSDIHWPAHSAQPLA